MLRRLENRIELAAERGCTTVRLRAASRPWDDAVLDLRWELADNGLTAEASVPTLDGGGIAS